MGSVVKNKASKVKMSLWVSVYILALFSIASAVPVDVEDAEHREDEDSVEEKVTDWRSSAVLPVLLNPFSVTKLTCTSDVTLYDGNDPDTTIEVDICFTLLLVTKLLVVITTLLEAQGITIQGGLFGILDTLGEGLARLGAEDDSFAAASRAFENSANVFSMFGFNLDGLNGWSDAVEYHEGRNQGTWGKMEKYVKQTLAEMDKAVTITHHHQE